MITLENCVGQCCNNPFGVCSHERNCEHHVKQDQREAKRQEWLDFVNGIANAPDLPPRKRKR